MTRKEAETKAYGLYSQAWDSHRGTPTPELNQMSDVVEARRVWVRFFNEIGAHLDPNEEIGEPVELR